MSNISRQQWQIFNSQIIQVCACCILKWIFKRKHQLFSRRNTLCHSMWHPLNTRCIRDSQSWQWCTHSHPNFSSSRALKANFCMNLQSRPCSYCAYRTSCLCTHCVGFVRYTQTTSVGVRSGREQCASAWCCSWTREWTRPVRQRGAVCACLQTDLFLSTPLICNAANRASSNPDTVG